MSGRPTRTTEAAGRLGPAADVRVHRHFDAPGEAVFDAWLTPEIMREWLFASPDGEIVDIATDPRVGGAFSILERREEGEIDHFGHYLEIDRPCRLAFSLRVPEHFPGETRVGVDISPAGRGCDLTFTQSGVEPSVVEDAWRRMLDRLAEVLAG